MLETVGVQSDPFNGRKIVEYTCPVTPSWKCTENSIQFRYHRAGHLTGSEPSLRHDSHYGVDQITRAGVQGFGSLHDSHGN